MRSNLHSPFPAEVRTLAAVCACWMCADPRFRSVHATPIHVSLLDTTRLPCEERARLN